MIISDNIKTFKSAGKVIAEILNHLEIERVVFLAYVLTTKECQDVCLKRTNLS